MACVPNGMAAMPAPCSKEASSFLGHVSDPLLAFLEEFEELTNLHQLSD